MVWRNWCRIRQRGTEEELGEKRGKRFKGGRDGYMTESQGEGMDEDLEGKVSDMYIYMEDVKACGFFLRVLDRAVSFLMGQFHHGLVVLLARNHASGPPRG